MLGRGTRREGRANAQGAKSGPRCEFGTRRESVVEVRRVRRGRDTRRKAGVDAPDARRQDMAKRLVGPGLLFLLVLSRACFKPKA